MEASSVQSASVLPAGASSAALLDGLLVYYGKDMPDKELEALIEEADECHRAKNYARELELRRRICEREPNNPFYEHNLALALMNNERFTEALDLFDRLAAQYPQLSRVHNNRAVLLLRMGFDLPYLVPAFLQALGTSADVPEFLIHFMNICGAIAYGLDEGAIEALDILDEGFPEVLEKVSPPELAEKNIGNEDSREFTRSSQE